MSIRGGGVTLSLWDKLSYLTNDGIHEPSRRMCMMPVLCTTCHVLAGIRWLASAHTIGSHVAFSQDAVFLPVPPPSRGHPCTHSPVSFSVLCLVVGSTTEPTCFLLAPGTHTQLAAALSPLRPTAYVGSDLRQIFIYILAYRQLALPAR